MSTTLRDIRTFPGLLAELREDQGWSQSRLGAEAGYDHSYICKLEAGQRQPSINTVAVLAEVLDCTPGDASRLFVAAGLLPPGRWVVRDDDADLLIRAAQEAAP
jgi:transcriptional regulator with XRE-family HTH domain